MKAQPVFAIPTLALPTLAALALAALMLASGPVAAQTAHSGASSVETAMRTPERRGAETRHDYWLSRDLNSMVDRFRTIRLR